MFDLAIKSVHGELFITRFSILMMFTLPLSHIKL